MELDFQGTLLLRHEGTEALSQSALTGSKRRKKSVTFANLA